MPIWENLSDILFLLAGGFCLGALCERFKQSAIVGYLMAGVLLGPNALQLVTSQEEVGAVAELGVALLLFAIGLEFSWARLRSLGSIPTLGGVIQVVATGAVAWGFGMFFGLSWESASGVAAIIALSSTACVLRQLTQGGEIGKVHGGYALGILLVQDLAVVALVLLMSGLSKGGSGFEIVSGMTRALGYGAGLFGAMFVIFHWVVPRLLNSRALHGNRELLVLLAVTSGLGAALAAHAVGLSPALGAFAAGMLLAGSPFAVQIRADISSLRTLLMTLFFVSVGMLADPAWMLQNWWLVLAMFTAVVLGKAVITWGALRVLGATNQSALAAGLCVAQIGEFSFVLAEIGRGNVLTEELFLLVISTTILTLLLTPYLVSSAPHLSARLARLGAVKGESGFVEPDSMCLVVGFGPAGRQVADQLREVYPKVMILDMNPRSVLEARELGFMASVGDARYGEVLEHIGLERIVLLAVTIPDPEDVVQIVTLVRSLSPKTLIVARARYHNSQSLIESAGAHIVVDEEEDVGHQLAAKARGLLGDVSSSQYAGIA
jgi:CPA2 family monovalent cation:H+ antiporter-2